MEKRGIIDAVVYQSESGWTVARLIDKEDIQNIFADTTTVVGVMPSVTEGVAVRLQGDWADHPKYGKQFKVDSYVTERPEDVDALEIYLAQVIKGIGPHIAKRIVQTFGTGTPEVMHDPLKLQTVSGIGPSNARDIVASWQEHEAQRLAMEDILKFLVEHNLSPAYAPQLYKAYGPSAAEVIKANPYRLTELHGIGFKRADAIAMQLGISKDAHKRVSAAITYALEEASKGGHVYMSHAWLADATAEITGLNDKSRIEAVLDHTVVDETVAMDRDRLYLPRLYAAETGIVQQIDRITQHNTPLTTDKAAVYRLIPNDLDYTDEQKAAVFTAVTHKISILTGGPGTGKTSIIKAIIQVVRRYGRRLMLLAPTGKAAKRMEEATGEMASTIHRALGVDPKTRKFIHNEDYPLEGDVFIVDESSMIDVVLADALLQAIPTGARVVLVGDINQLPSVGPGNFLKDMIASHRFPVTRLNKIWRQSAESLIIPNAHAINHGQMPQFGQGRVGDFHLIEAEDAASAGDWIAQLVCKWIPKNFGYNPEDIQVLTPQHKTDAGTIALNRRLQRLINPPGKPEITVGQRVFRVGDRVIHTRNDYDKGVFNGDSGTIAYITKIDKEIEIGVEIDGATIAYTRQEAMDDLQLAYALTVHKSQGSEFPVVVMPVITAHYIMLQRNLLYTGVTRAQQLVVLVGSQRAIGIAVRNDKIEQRNSYLATRLRRSP